MVQRFSFVSLDVDLSSILGRSSLLYFCGVTNANSGSKRMDYKCSHPWSARFRDVWFAFHPVNVRNGIWSEPGARVALSLDGWNDWLLVGHSMQANCASGSCHEYHVRLGRCRWLLRISKYVTQMQALQSDIVPRRHILFSHIAICFSN